MLRIALAALAALQEPVVPAVPPAPFIPAAPSETAVPQPCCLLKALTPVFLSIDEPLVSDTAQIGQSFRISLRQPIVLADGRTIPVGTTGIGQVVHAAKSRAMGKAGEMILAARHLDFDGRRIPLRSLRYGRGQGKDNVDTAAIVSVAVSALVAPFITGGEVRILPGTEVWAKVAADTEFPGTVPPAAVAAGTPPVVPSPPINPTKE